MFAVALAQGTIRLNADGNQDYQCVTPPTAFQRKPVFRNFGTFIK
jgi:hypothetical protein